MCPGPATDCQNVLLPECVIKSLNSYSPRCNVCPTYNSKTTSATLEKCYESVKLRFLTASFDNTVQICTAGVDSSAPPLVLRPSGRLSLSALSPSGGAVLTVAGAEGLIWCPETGNQLAELHGEVACAVFSPLGHSLGGLDEDGAVRLWCATTGRCLRALPAPEPEEDEGIRLAAFSPDGRMLLTSIGCKAQILNVATGKPSCEDLLGHTDHVTCAAFSPDSKLVATGSLDGTLRIWCTCCGECVQELQHASLEPTSVIFSASGMQVLAVSTSGVLVWKFQDPLPGFTTPCIPAKLQFELEGSGPTTAASFSVDDEHILMASSKDVCVFDANAGTIVTSLVTDGEWVRSASFVKDSCLLLTGDYEGSVALWDWHTSKQLWTSCDHKGAVTTAAAMFL